MKAKVIGYKVNDNDTILQIKVDEDITKQLKQYNNNGVYGELQLDDGRRITADQRKKLYATFSDIADWNGDMPEYIKEYLKFMFCSESGNEYFSLSDCSVTTAREFISYVVDFVVKHGIQMKELAIDRTDDISKYLYSCLKYRKCCVCGRQGDIHHCTGSRIGMGSNRLKTSNEGRKLICLCREHHTKAHSVPESEFFSLYKVYGIEFND